MSSAPSPKTPRTPTQLVTSPPRVLSTPQSEHASKGLNILLQNAAANATSASPLSAIFLVQFDVKSGYVLKWSKKVNDNVSLKGVEFKSLPSGLHEIERDVISFVQIHGNESENETKPLDNLLYGVSVFHQNLNEHVGGSRNKVKMFSLGVLVDPLSQIQTKSVASKFSGDIPTWKPMHFTSGLEYVDQLHKLLDDWDNSSEDYSTFEDFFDKHSSKLDLLDIIGSKSPKSPSLPKIDTQTLHSSLVGKHHSHHFLLSLPSLLEHLGPLIFRVWRSALLRERILIFDAPTVELNCAFAYCLAILSTIPQEIHWLLNESGCWAASDLQFIQPVYSIGVNDIDWLKSLVSPTPESKDKISFIASTTDEILLFKSTLYDISVQFNQPHHVTSRVPKAYLAESSIPGAKNTDPLKATQRDLRRFKILAKEFKFYSEDGQTPSAAASPVNLSVEDYENAKEITKAEFQEEPWWLQVSEPASWKELAWSGFYWWASAGENGRMSEEQEIDGLKENGDINRNEIERSLILVGYFQNMTKRILSTIADIINNENEDQSNDNDDDADPVENIIWIEPGDIFEMGLDPYSAQDADFVVRLIKVWWNKEAKVGTKLSNICCF